MNSFINSPSLADIRAMASGKWVGIFTSLGIPERYLDTHRHQPCPSCGGRDRFRFTNYQDTGGFICNQCSPEGGSGFDLIMLVFNCSFSESLAMVSEKLGIGAHKTDAPREIVQAPITKPKVAVNRLHRLHEHLRKAQTITRECPAAEYLVNRGLDWDAISHDMQCLYYHPQLACWTGSQKSNRPIRLGHYPAMIASLRKGNALMGLHITYLGIDANGAWGKLSLHHPETGELLPAKKMQTRHSGALKGSAIQLYAPHDDAIALCEGLETALAVRQMFNLPVWACASAWGMRNIELPPSIKCIYLVADNDVSNTGQDACRDLTNRAIQAGIEVKQ